MRSFGRSLSAVLVGSLGAFALLAVAPGAQAVSGAAIRITEFSHTGRVVRPATGDGEYVELTNIGDAPADLTGWTYDNKAADPANGLSLTGLGTVAPGESVIVADLSAAEFRSEWHLKDSVKVLSNGRTHTLSSGPDAIHVYDNGGAEVDSVSYDADFLPVSGESAWVDAAYLGAKADTTGWITPSALPPTNLPEFSDADESWSSALRSIGSPGASLHHGTQTRDDVRDDGPEATCDTEFAGWSPGVPPGNPYPSAWPGTATPAAIDAECAWVTPESGDGLSGLVFDPNDANVLYAVQDTGHLYRLVRSGGSWVKDTANGWADGKDLRFPGGTGRPDTEGVTVGSDGALYVTTERDNAVPGVPLDSVLKFDPTSAGTTLVATDQWVLTPDLYTLKYDAESKKFVKVGLTNADADFGLEGITYVPDSFLTANRFRTDADVLYDPASYPTKATAGLLFVAAEATGHLLAYVLNTDHTYTQVADSEIGGTADQHLTSVMDVSFDPEIGRLWVQCDNVCADATLLLKVAVDGHLAYDASFFRPADLPNFAFEGFAVAPASTASEGVREVLWADDGNRLGHSLWSGTLDADMHLAMVATPLPVIVGMPVVGSTLTAQIGAWEAGATVHYQWSIYDSEFGEDVVIGTDAPLLVDPTLVGKMVKLSVTGSRNLFRDATVTSSIGITDGSLTTYLPRILGVVAVGKTLTAGGAAWGPAGVKLSYQWLANGQPIARATRKTLRLTKAQFGKRISVRVNGTKAGYTGETEQSHPSTRVKGLIATKRPVIGGRAEVGNRLVARPGGRWRADGRTVRYRYQWYVNGKAARGATQARFEVSRALKGKRIRVRVTGSASGYVTVSRTSVATGKVT